MRWLGYILAGIHKLLWHAYALFALMLAYEAIKDNMAWHHAMFKVAQVEAAALAALAHKLVGV